MRVQCAEDFLLELQAFVHRFDHQVRLCQRREILYRAYSLEIGVGLELRDALFTHLLRPGLLNHGQARAECRGIAL
ncbi:hypothetical protein D3C84_1199450 [compost metagenome]